MHTQLRLRLLAIAAGLLGSLLVVTALPQLELTSYDVRLLLYRNSPALQGVRQHPAIILVAYRQASQETYIRRQTSGQAAARIFNLIADAKPADTEQEQEAAPEPVWGPKQDAEVLDELAKHDAKGIFLRRRYDGETDEDLLPLVAAAGQDRVLIGALYLTSASRQNELPDLLRKVEPQNCCDLERGDDGVYRSGYLALQSGGGRPIPSAALIFFARLKGLKPSAIEYQPNGIRVGATYIPCQRDGFGYTLPIRYQQIGTMHQGLVATLAGSDSELQADYMDPVSLRSLLDEQNPNRESFFKHVPGRIVFIGDYQYEAAHERSTPLGKVRDFQAQAMLLDTLLSGWYLRPLNSALGMTLWIVTLFLLSGRWVRLEGTQLAAEALVTVPAYVFLAQICFEHGYLLPVTTPSLSILFMVLTISSGQLYNTLQNIRRFGGRGAEEAARRLDQGALFENFEREATILFTILPEHLKALERLQAPELFERRKQYSELVIEIVNRYRGFILDYQADALMVGFNVASKSIEDPDHAEHAIAAAWEIVKQVEALKDQWVEALEPNAMQVCCGICTGMVAVGFVGAREHKKAPAAIGDTTNVAARLLFAGKKLGVKVLISEPTYELAKARVEAEPMPPVSLKGKTHLVAVYNALRLRGPGESPQ